MSSVFQPRSCGSFAWRTWVAGAWTSLRRWPWEVSLGLVLGLACWAWLASQWMGFLVPLILVGVALQPVFDAWFDRTRRAAALSVLEALSIARERWPRWAHPIVLLGALGLGWMLQTSVAWNTSGNVLKDMGAVWLLGLWVPLCFRPWGPVGFWGQLWRQGCPLSSLARLQLGAVSKNIASLSLLCLTWFIVLGALMVTAWLAPLAWVVWVAVCRGAFVDIFQGGLTMEKRESVAVVSSVPRPAR